MSKPKKASETGRTPMDEALRFLGPRARTVREVERHLDRCEFGEVEIDAVTARLSELGLIGDEAYAKEYVRTRLATKPVSREHLRMQLLAHETDESAIDLALLDVDEQAQAKNALAVAGKYVRQYAKLPPEERREMVIRRLLSRGYSYDEARAALEGTLGGEE